MEIAKPLVSRDLEEEKGGMMPAKAKILIVDDEARIVKTVQAYLENEGYETLAAYDGEAALEIWRRESPDLVVLDIMMPKLDGLGFCREVRKTSATPIIILSARSAEEDKLAGLDLGADDYITKPFSPRELVARIRALQRRLGAAGEARERPIAEGPMNIDRGRRRVTVEEQEVVLTATEFDILALMASHPEQVYSKEQLLLEVQGDSSEAYDSAIYSHIKNLRRKLAGTAVGWSFIETVHGAGYRFNAGKKTQP
jgi:DNA-binding response OmpR family regulator